MYQLNYSKKNSTAEDMFIYKKIEQTRPLFCLVSVFFKQTFLFLLQSFVKISIQIMVLGLEPTTFRLRVSSHNH